MDVVGLVRQAGAVAADDRLQRLVEAAVIGIGGGEPLARRLGPVAQPGEIDIQHAPVLDHHLAADHDAVDGVAVLGMHQLVYRVVAGEPVRVVEIEQYQIGLVAGRDAADPVAEAERAGAALGRRQGDLARRQPALPIRPMRLRDEGSEPHRLVHVLVVGAVGAIGADAEIDEPGAEAHVAAGIVRDRGAMVAEPGHVVIIKPDAVRDGEMRAQDAELVEMRGQRLAIELDAGQRLHFRLGDMAVQPDIEIAGDRGAAENEFVRAVMRDRRRHRRAYPVAVGRPGLEPSAHRRQGRFRRGEA